jgi:hypothetical protein
VNGENVYNGAVNERRRRLVARWLQSNILVVGGVMLRRMLLMSHLGVAECVAGQPLLKRARALELGDWPAI